MKSYGNKSLIKVDGETLLLKQIRTIRDKFPQIAEIVVVAGYETDKVVRTLSQTQENIKIVENELYLENNAMRSLSMGLRVCLTNNIIVIHGDILFDKNSLDFSTFSTIPLDNHKRILDDKVGSTVDNDKNVIALDYGLPSMWAQIAFLTGKELSLVRKICVHREWDNFTTHEILNKAISQGGKIKTFELKKEAILKELNAASDIEL